LDGSKVDAPARKHKPMSYGRMQTEIDRLEREIREFAAQAERVDQQSLPRPRMRAAHPN